jgi:LuxR family maltose regulon positive regulatory protein
LAALLAEACSEGGKPDESRALLAGRLHVIEHYGLPAALVAAYRTMARVADQEGRQDQALDILGSLCAIGETRAMPRLQIAAKCELTRIHARHSRAETALQLSQQLDMLAHNSRHHWPAPLAPWLELHTHLARAYAAVAADGNSMLPTAIQAADSAVHLATLIKRDGDALDALLLRAEALRRLGVDEASRARQEAISLAQANGAVRLLRDHSALASAPTTHTATSPQANHTTSTSAAQVSPRGSGLLTAKEREILLLLSRNLSNKEIALALAVSEQTVKWHVKNVFNKINAGSRKHAVARARLLGLIG